MLVKSQRNQVSGVDVRIHIESFVLPDKLLSVWCKHIFLFSLGEHIAKKSVSLRVPGIAGAVPSIVAYIERLVAGRSLAKGSEFIQTVRAFHATDLSGIGLQLFQHVVLLSVQQK